MLEQNWVVTKVNGFADELRNTLDGIFPEVSQGFHIGIREGSPRVSVSTKGEGDPRSLVLKIDQCPLFKIDLTYLLTVPKNQKHLKVVQSKFHVFSMSSGIPLFRYEYDDQPKHHACAHLHVHVHRDEMVFAAALTQRIQGEKYLDMSSMRTLSRIHFPLGGARFRPCIEDILQMLIQEFKVDANPEYKKAIEEGRCRWRKIQLAAAIRDDPETAKTTLSQIEDSPPYKSGSNRQLQF